MRIADKVMYQNGTTMLSFQNKRPDGDSIDRYTAQTLQKYLRQVVTSDKGTGRRFQDLPFHIAGNQALPKLAAKINRGIHFITSGLPDTFRQKNQNTLWSLFTLMRQVAGLRQMKRFMIL